jgi:transcription antitermination factor NusG
MGGEISILKWVAIYTEPRRENMVCAQLQHDGLIHYHATYKRRVHRKGVLVTNAPLFPRYVFLRIENGYRGVSTYRGVCNLLTNDGRPVMIPAQVIEEIRENQEKGLFDEKPSAKKQPPMAKSFKELKRLLDMAEKP